MNRKNDKVFLKVSPALHRSLRGFIQAKSLSNTDELIDLIIKFNQGNDDISVTDEGSEKEKAENFSESKRKKPKVAAVKFEPNTFYRFKGLSKAKKKTYIELIEQIIEDRKAVL